MANIAIKKTSNDVCGHVEGLGQTIHSHCMASKVYEQVRSVAPGNMLISGKLTQLSSKGEVRMTRDAVTTRRLVTLMEQMDRLTRNGELHWERQIGSAHRYARWKNNLLILGPAEPLSNTSVPRYLFITPFDSPACIEINSTDAELGSALIELVGAVEKASQNEPPTDPFAISEDILGRLGS